MRTGGLTEMFRTLLDKGVSNQELIRLLQNIENDATEIYHAKYGLDDKIMFIRQTKRKVTRMYQTIYQEKFRFNEWRNKDDFSIVFNRMWRITP
jgi:hypothetical protein